MFHLRRLYECYVSYDSVFDSSFQFKGVGALAIVTYFELILEPAKIEPHTTSLNEDTLKVCRSHLEQKLSEHQLQCCLQDARCFLLYLFEADYMPNDYSHVFKPKSENLGGFNELEYRKKWH